MLPVGPVHIRISADCRTRRNLFLVAFSVVSSFPVSGFFLIHRCSRQAKKQPAIGMVFVQQPLA
jgi:hypothetical protein